MNDIVGTWRLVMTRARNDAGEPMHPPYGPNPMGVVVFSPDRRMVAVLCDARPVLPDAEPEREYSSYCGAYPFDGAPLVRWDAASRAVLGTERVTFQILRLHRGGSNSMSHSWPVRHNACPRTPPPRPVTPWP